MIDQWFKQDIDEILSEHTRVVIIDVIRTVLSNDDGVGKNIAPLQQRGMLAYEVLNKGQLKKYLNADW